MSVLVRTPDNRVMIVCKGADSIINARLAKDQKWVKETNDDLERFAEVGLRTLLIAYKYLDEDFYSNWLVGFKQAESSTQNRD